jgi:hypothetical protein
VATLGALRPVELDHDLLAALEMSCQSGAVTAGALGRPRPQSRVLVGEPHQLGVAISGGLDGDVVEDAAGAGIDRSCRVGVDVGSTPMTTSTALGAANAEPRVTPELSRLSRIGTRDLDHRDGTKQGCRGIDSSPPRGVTKGVP